MEAPDKGDRHRYLRHRYAPFGYTPGQGPHGDVYRRSRSPDTVLCGPEREGKHQKTAASGDRGRQSPGCQVW